MHMQAHTHTQVLDVDKVSVPCIPMWDVGQFGSRGSSTSLSCSRGQSLLYVLFRAHGPEVLKPYPTCGSFSLVKLPEQNWASERESPTVWLPFLKPVHTPNTALKGNQ